MGMKVYRDKNIIKVEFDLADPEGGPLDWTLTLQGAQSDELYAKFLLTAIKKRLRQEEKRARENARKTSRR